jgi:hypothetical protein
MNGRWSSKARGSWTTIARAPWLKAVAFFPKGDCWNGGGLFLDKRSYWLNDGCRHENAVQTSELRRVDAPAGMPYFGGECLTVYYNRLMRDGWIMTGQTSRGSYDATTVFEKGLPRGWKLRKICHEQIGSPPGKGCYWDEHVLVSRVGTEIARPDWEWAERLNGEVAYAAGGRLFRRVIRDSETLGVEKLVHDLNGYEFEAFEAPY